MRVYENSALASLCKRSFYDFLIEFWDVIVGEEPVINWHIKYLCDELQFVAERVFKGEPKLYDLIVNVPPGSTKSTICSQAFPAWCWTRMPSAKFICGCYAHQVALKDSLKTRDIIQSDKYQQCFPMLQLREDENTKGLFTNTETGFRLSVGVGGLVTGYHGHFLLVDDPINPEEAFSEAELKATNRWMRQTLPSRKVDKKVSVTILIQQRLAEADPTGEMLERTKGVGVKHIKLPGELLYDDKTGKPNVEPPELAQHYKNGLLDPDRLPREVLNKSKEEMGLYGYSAQILQDPVPLGGGMFLVDKLQYLDDCPELIREVRSWDKAGTQDGGAYSVGVRMGVDKKGRYIVIDVRRGQWGSTLREDRIKETADEDGDDVEVVLEIEGGSGGKESGESTVKNLAGYRVFVYHPTGDKEARAYPFSSQVGAGNVYLLKRDWNKAYVEELRHFSNTAKYKDQVDASSGAFNRIALKKIKRAGAF